MRVSRTQILLALGISAAFGQAPGYQTATTPDLTLSDSFVNVTSTAIGNICVNVYAFDAQKPDKLFACCATSVAPGQPYSMSARDIIPNTTYPFPPSSLIIKLVTSRPLDTPGRCNAASTIVDSLPPGLQASLGSAPGATGVPFQGSAIGSSELNTLTSACLFIQTSGSGFGLCKGLSVVNPLDTPDGRFLYILLFFH